MLLAGDVGGTKTLLGLFEPAHPRPALITHRSYPTNEFASFSEILAAFARDVGGPFRVEAAAAGVAGPVVGGTARLTNISWDVSTREIAAHLGTTRVALLNDLEATAEGAQVLAPEELITLQRGTPRGDGNAAVIAAGTGLGQAYLHRVGGRLVPVASEGGHADFAARTDREIDLVRMLRSLYGRAEVEHVLSGPGLINLYRLTHGARRCDAIEGEDPADAPARVTQMALEGSCTACEEALSLFVEAYGAEAGNLGLRGMATAGVYVGGGIAPKILPALQDGRFIGAFRAKGSMSDLAASMPVYVILLPETGLVGAAVAAQALTA